MIFAFGQSEHERIEVDVLGYERASVGDYYDDNWLTVQIRARVGGFRGIVNAAILTDELVAFLAQLRPLHQSLRGVAEFTTLEEQLHMRLAGDGRGQIELIADMDDQPGIGNRLHFTLNFDQSQLGVSIRDCEKVVSQFPVRPT
jgi:hypothetical protein